MNRLPRIAVHGPAILVLLLGPSAAATGFTYQGQIKQDGVPLNATVDMSFVMFHRIDTNTSIFPVVDRPAVQVVNGLFQVELDFGDGAFNGSTRYLEISVRVPPAVEFVTLTPRQSLTAAPFAIFALSAPGDGTGGGTLNDAYNFGGAGAGREIVANAGGVYVSGADGIQSDGGLFAPPVKIARADGNLDVEVRRTLNLSGDPPDPVTVGGTLRRGTVLSPIEDWAYLRVAPIGHALRRKIGTSLAFDVEGAVNSAGIWISQMFLNADGNLGVGTVIPVTKLHVDGGSDAQLGQGGYVTVGSFNSANLVLDNNEIMARNAGFISTLFLNNDGGDILMLRDAGVGDVGIGTSNPKGKLHVAGDYYGLGHVWLHAFEGDGESGTAYIQARDTSSTSNVDLRLRTKAGSTLREAVTIKSTGRVGIGTTAPAQLLHVAGTARVDVLQITGGADLSEGFSVHAERVEPGMVVCIDPQRPGQLVPCREAYDRKVAGIVSGAGGVATGMVMGHSGTLADGEHPVALSGRVYCLADASKGAISPGDLLTTSSVPGHAMKVQDYDRGQGAIMGKAMTALDAGTGLVLVLVSLQ